MKAKKFDCVQMKRRGGALVKERLKNMSEDEQLRFWQQGTNELRNMQQKAKNGKRAKQD